MKNIFISAYACAPSGVSELSVGWNIIKNISKLTNDYRLIIVTQENDVRLNVKKDIEQYIKLNGDLNNVEFYYFDVPIIKNRKIRNLPGFHYVYYYIWQIMLYMLYKKLERKYDFKIVHHLTFVTMNQPTFLYKSKKPFIWGPIGGAEVIPETLHKNIRKVDLIKEKIRSLLIRIKRYSLNITKCIDKSKYIITVNNDTTKFIGDDENKVELIPAIGYESFDKTKYNESKNDKLKIITVGLVYYRKGTDICIDVAKRLKERDINFEWSIIGRPFNNEIINYNNLLEKYNLRENMIFYNEMPHDEVMREIEKSDVMAFLTRKDSGGFVALESLQNNTPVVTFNIGGPSEIINIDNDFGITIDIDMPYEKIIDHIVNAFINTNFRKMKENIHLKKDKLDCLYKWEQKAKRIIKLYDEC